MISKVFLKNDSSDVNANAGYDDLEKRRQRMLVLVLFVFLMIGILGNMLALVKLARKRNYSNNSYTMMLRSLVTNNLIGLVGVTAMITSRRFLSNELFLEYTRYYCASWVIFRFFGISSGCIAVIMSIDRYMILSHPIFYREHFSSKLNKNAIIGLCFVACIITFLPLFGFGVYFDKDTNKCLRYRDARTFLDKVYAVLFLIFGSLICLTIVTCNTFVMKSILNRRQRRISNSSSSSSQSSLRKNSTIDIRFSKLMAFLSLTFVICWMPQMVSIVLALKPNPLPQNHWFYGLADKLIALLFTLDPYIYVLSGKNLLKFCCFSTKRSNQVSINSNTVDCSL